MYIWSNSIPVSVYSFMYMHMNFTHVVWTIGWWFGVRSIIIWILEIYSWDFARIAVTSLICLCTYAYVCMMFICKYVRLYYVSMCSYDVVKIYPCENTLIFNSLSLSDFNQIKLLDCCLWVTMVMNDHSYLFMQSFSWLGTGEICSYDFHD